MSKMTNIEYNNIVYYTLEYDTTKSSDLIKLEQTIQELGDEINEMNNYIIKSDATVCISISGSYNKNNQMF